MERVHSIRNRVYEEADAPPNFEKLGVEVISGRARFLDPHTLEVQSKGGVARLTSRRFVVATGSSFPALPRLETDGSEVSLLTNETLFELEKRPKHLLVLGAGPIGVEMAQAFQRLGSSVTVAGHGSEILPRDDRELAGMLREQLRGEGIRFLFGTEIVRIEEAPHGPQAASGSKRTPCSRQSGANPTSRTCSSRRPVSDPVRRGIEVNLRCQSSARHTYAAGDVAGRIPLHAYGRAHGESRGDQCDPARPGANRRAPTWSGSRFPIRNWRKSERPKPS